MEGKERSSGTIYIHTTWYYIICIVLYMTPIFSIPSHGKRKTSSFPLDKDCFYIIPLIPFSDCLQNDGLIWTYTFTFHFSDRYQSPIRTYLFSYTVKIHSLFSDSLLFLPYYIKVSTIHFKSLYPKYN